MTDENKKSPEEIAKEKEELRKISLNTLNSGISNIAAAALIEKYGYGAPLNADAERFLYVSGVSSREWIDAINPEVLTRNVLGSRVKDRPYAGSVNLKDSEILNSCEQRYMQALTRVKFSDLVTLMRGEITDEYKEKYESLKETYIEDLDPETQQDILAGYQNYFIKMKVAEASIKGAEMIKKQTLEAILKKEEPTA